MEEEGERRRGASGNRSNQRPANPGNPRHSSPPSLMITSPLTRDTNLTTVESLGPCPFRTKLYLTALSLYNPETVPDGASTDCQLAKEERRIHPPSRPYSINEGAPYDV